MFLSPGKLDGVWIVGIEQQFDERGYLAKSFCRESFEACGLAVNWDQVLTSLTEEVGTVRGMHWQADPVPEKKLIRCARGRIYDVLVDIRPNSPTFGEWECHVLSPSENKALYAPQGFAHGFQNLETWSEVEYLIAGTYRSDLQCGFVWCDDTVAINWPLEVKNVSKRDQSLPLLTR